MLNDEYSDGINQVPPKHWRLYERIVASKVVDDYGKLDLSITPNARIRGVISKIWRQVDVLVDARFEDDISRRIIVDAKDYGRKLHVKDIESFLSMMQDCEAQRGILFCPHGYSKGAKRRAQDAIVISVLSELELEQWELSLELCYGRCKEKLKGRDKAGVVLWDGFSFVGVNEAWLGIYTGKCDVCKDFHIFCWECGEKFALGVEESHHCFCGYSWQTLVEEDASSRQETVWLTVLINSNILVLDRRKL